MAAENKEEKWSCASVSIHKSVTEVPMMMPKESYWQFHTTAKPYKE